MPPEATNSPARKSGILIYRCRRCGKFEHSGRIENLTRAVNLTIGRGVIQDWDEAYHENSAHYCEPGRVGILELIGADELEFAEEKAGK